MCAAQAILYHFCAVKNKFHWSELILVAIVVVVALAMMRHAIVYAGL